jgi:hypothetical protein
MAIEDLRRNRMMSHLAESLEGGCNIGHYGRLVFTMIGRHFLDEDELVGLLTRDPDCPELKARALYRQVQEHDYSPPTRERILEWQSHQDFPIVPDAEDPDAANVYKDLQFPDRVYEHISEYYEQKVGSESS